MSRNSISNFYKFSIATLGGLCFVLSFFRLKDGTLSWTFALLFAFTILIAPRMSITLPRSKYILNFSDSIIFLTFLLFGGEAAIFIATVEMLAFCLLHKSVSFKLSLILTNISIACLSTSLTFYIWLLFQQILELNLTFSSTTNLITSLGILALSQFFFTSI